MPGGRLAYALNFAVEFPELLRDAFLLSLAASLGPWPRSFPWPHPLFCALTACGTVAATVYRPAGHLLHDQDVWRVDVLDDHDHPPVPLPPPLVHPLPQPAVLWPMGWERHRLWRPLRQRYACLGRGCVRGPPATLTDRGDTSHRFVGQRQVGACDSPRDSTKRAHRRQQGRSERPDDGKSVKWATKWATLALGPGSRAM